MEVRGVFGFDGGVLFHGAAFGGVLNLGLELIEHRGCEDFFLGVLGGVLGLVVEAGADGGVGDLLLGGLGGKVQRLGDVDLFFSSFNDVVEFLAGLELSEIRCNGDLFRGLLEQVVGSDEGAREVARH